MTLLDAAIYDGKRARLRRMRTVGFLFLACTLAIGLYLMWNLPEEHRVNQFFAAVESKGLSPGIWHLEQ